MSDPEDVPVIKGNVTVTIPEQDYGLVSMTTDLAMFRMGYKRKKLTAPVFKETYTLVYEPDPDSPYLRDARAVTFLYLTDDGYLVHRDPVADEASGLVTTGQRVFCRQVRV